MNRPRTSAKVLLVEGKDDLHVVANLGEALGLPDYGLWIKEKGGYDNLLLDLEGELLASGLQRLGILVDADLDARNRWTSLRKRLIAAGYVDLPPQPDPDGIVAMQTGKPTIGVWIMPDNTLPGALEDFIACLVPEDDTLWPRAGDCLAQLPENERRFPPQDLIKARVHTWLAWQKEPGKPMGQAITARYLSPGVPQVALFVDWLRRLFQL